MSQTAVTNAELRQAMEKLSAAFIKSTAKTGIVLFGDAKDGSTGMVGAEMKMGFSSADMTKSSLNAQADGMICAGVFSIVAGCAAIGGAGAEAGAISGEVSASAEVEVDAMPTVEEGAEPAAQATADVAPAEEGATTETSTESPDSPEKTEEEMLERDEQALSTDSSDPQESEMRMEERTQVREEETRTKDAHENEEAEKATVEVENSQRGMTAEQKTAAKEKISKEAQQKIAKAQGIPTGRYGYTASDGISGTISVQAGRSDRAIRSSCIRQTEQQAINTSSQVAQKFYGDLQQGVTAAGQTVDLINQTVVASSRI